MMTIPAHTVAIEITAACVNYADVMQRQGSYPPPVMLKRLTITGSTLRARDAVFKANIAKQLKTQVWSLIASGQIKPIIHSIFPLAEAHQAHQLMESSQHLGKIILKV